MAVATYMCEGDVFTAYTIANVSGGEMVKIRKTSNNVVTSSGMSSYAATDIQVTTADIAGSLICGITLHPATSGNPVAIRANGMYIIQGAATVNAGCRVCASGVPAVATVIEMADTGSPIGRAYTTSDGTTTGSYIIANLDFR